VVPRTSRSWPDITGPTRVLRDCRATPLIFHLLMTVVSTIRKTNNPGVSRDLRGGPLPSRLAKTVTRLKRFDKLTPAHVEAPLAQHLKSRRVEPLRKGHQDRPRTQLLGLYAVGLSREEEPRRMRRETTGCTPRVSRLASCFPPRPTRFSGDDIFKTRKHHTATYEVLMHSGNQAQNFGTSCCVGLLSKLGENAGPMRAGRSRRVTLLLCEQGGRGASRSSYPLKRF